MADAFSDTVVQEITETMTLQVIPGGADTGKKFFLADEHGMIIGRNQDCD